MTDEPIEIEDGFYTPVFLAGENFFIIPTEEMIFETFRDAFVNGVGYSLVEGVLGGFRYAGVFEVVNPKNLLHTPAEMAAPFVGSMRVAIVYGPVLDNSSAEIEIPDDVLKYSPPDWWFEREHESG